MAQEQSIYRIPERLVGFENPTVWHEFTPLANQHGAVNLGQGFPDWEPPQFCKDALCEAVQMNQNQYAPSAGHPDLLQTLASRYSGLMEREINPKTEITISVGATEGIFAALQSLITPGDEVLVLEPAFDIYMAQTQMAGGVCVYVPLRPIRNETTNKIEWQLNMDELQAAITDKTRVMLLNTPHNPTGKVFTRSELESISQIVQNHPNLVVVTDEVYENILFGSSVHTRLATLPGMWERTLTVSSAGKTFSITGWKVGWLIGHEKLIKMIMLANQWIQFSVPTPLQAAVAKILRQAELPFEGESSFFEFLRKDYERKRNNLVNALHVAGMESIIPDGGIFVMADTSKLAFPEKYLKETTPAAPVMSRDWAFCRWLTIEKGVTPIPPSAFYSADHKHLAENLARFAYCKRDDVLLAALQRFEEMANDSPNEKK